MNRIKEMQRINTAQGLRRLSLLLQKKIIVILASRVLPPICSLSNQIWYPNCFKDLANRNTVDWLSQLYEIIMWPVGKFLYFI
jgi:hypothetical protein